MKKNYEPAQLQYVVVDLPDILTISVAGKDEKPDFAQVTDLW